MLLEQSIDFICAPKVVIDLACLGLSYGGKLNYTRLAMANK